MAKIEIEHYMPTESSWRASFADDAITAVARVIYDTPPEEIERDMITVATRVLDVEASISDGLTEVELRIEGSDLPKPDDERVARLRGIGREVHELLMAAKSTQMVPILGRAILANELIIWPTMVADSGWQHPGSGRRVFSRGDSGLYRLK